MNRPSLHCSWKAREMAHLLTLKLIGRVDCEENVKKKTELDEMNDQTHSRYNMEKF